MEYHLLQFRLPVLASIYLLGCAAQICAAPQENASSQVTTVTVLPIDNQMPAAPDGVYDLSKVDFPPRAKSQARPTYPRELRLAMVSGEVVILFTVAPKGSVVNPTIEKTTDNRFNDVALRAVSNWSFEPATVGGRTVSCQLMVPISFAVSRYEEPPPDIGGTQLEADLGSKDRIVDISKVTVQPTAIFQTRPDYPTELKAEKVSGKALIYFIVKTNGHVSNVRVVSASDPWFGRAGAAAVRKWRFHPALQGDHVVNCQVEVPLRWDWDS
jgi:TonB family protein